MSEKKITIALSNRLVKDIDERGGSRPKTIETDLSSLYSLEFFTIYELKGIFVPEELGWLATHCIDGFARPSYVEPKSFLLNNIATAFDKQSLLSNLKYLKKNEHSKAVKEFNQMDNMRSKIYEKVQKLTAFQVYTLMRRIEIALERSVKAMEGISIDYLARLFSPQGN